jgi:hypothetical protein
MMSTLSHAHSTRHRLNSFVLSPTNAPFANLPRSGIATLGVVGNLRPGMRRRPGEMMLDMIKVQQTQQACELCNRACDTIIKVWGVGGGGRGKEG